MVSTCGSATAITCLSPGRKMRWDARVWINDEMHSSLHSRLMMQPQARHARSAASIPNILDAGDLLQQQGVLAKHPTQQTAFDIERWLQATLRPTGRSG